ncbi:hypothetical protein [Jatrophihabitans fulvus]
MTQTGRSDGRRRAGRVLLVMLVAVVGALVGVVVGVLTPAHVEIAGSDARIRLEPGRTVDQVGVTGVVTLTRATDRAVLGEPVGVRATLDFDASQLVRDGKVNTDVLPAYVAAYSDPEQLVSDIRHEMIWHFVRWMVAGAATALLVVVARWAYRRWRTRYDAVHDPDGAARATTRAYLRRERLWTVRAAAAAVVVLAIAQLPSARSHLPARQQVEGNPVLADTPLRDVEVSGLLAPVLVAARDYIRTYAGQTDSYYDKLRDRLVARLQADPVTLPGETPNAAAASGSPSVQSGAPSGAEGEFDVAHFGFVTDRHCNTGMDRVTVTLLEKLGVHTLVSAGDDAFSGTFAFESACTRGLAQQSKRADVTDVMAGGNHDSPTTIAAERDQGMKVLDDADDPGGPTVVETDGLRFVGSPDPRTSRYGEGIRPASAAARTAALQKQAKGIAQRACDDQKPLIVVAHDPQVGDQALQQGCGHATLALTGHTHRQDGPVTVPLPDGGDGSQFTGGSAGGAPGEEAVDRTFASSLTVGPLNHDAFVYVVSVDRGTGALVGITAFRFTPDQQIEVTQLPG